VVINGVAITAVHLSKEWLNKNVSKTLADKINMPVTVLNDADAAGLAEIKFGAGRRYQERGVVLMLTLGTGIGSALFVGGRLVPNTEFGHVYIEGVEAETMAAASRRTVENLSWEIWGGRVNRVLVEMEKLLSPELIILGGGVSENFDKFSPYLKTQADLARAMLGNDAGIIGAAVAAIESIG
jgi:polyphosphate glucokinase